MNQDINQAYILLGSNILPIENLNDALANLSQLSHILKISNAWENLAVGSPGPNYINLVALIETPFTIPEVKELIVAPIETKLGRVRTTEKNSPRTIDLDLIIYNDQILEPDIWTHLYIALPLSELLPELVNPNTRLNLQHIANNLRETNWALIHPEIKI
jgi:2-amino-4-hydroxy-6-hydroxymethyldihydropteridine diphosphokinase